MGTADIQGRSRQVSLPVWLVWMDDSLLVVIRVGVSLVIGPRFPPAGADARPAPALARRHGGSVGSEEQFGGQAPPESDLHFQLLQGLGHLQLPLGHGMG